MDSQKLEILVFCPQTPNGYNSGGGPTRSYFILRQLALKHHIHLAILDYPNSAPIPKDLEKLCKSVLWPKKLSKTKQINLHASRLRKAFANLGSTLLPWEMTPEKLLTAGEVNCVTRPEAAAIGKPLDSVAVTFIQLIYGIIIMTFVAFGTLLFNLRPARGIERYAMFENIQRQLQRNFSEDQIDILWIEHSYLFPEVLRLSKKYKGSKICVNSHNVEYILHGHYEKLAKSRIAKLWYRLQKKSIEHFERIGYNLSSLTICCSKDDAERIENIAPLSQIVVVENGVDTSFFHQTCPEAHNPVVLYTGGFGYWPNDDAVIYFYEDIFPLILKKVPECHFFISGFQAKERFGKLFEQDTKVKIFSDVPDIRPYFSIAWVVVVSLRSGSGSRLKILEALSMGKAVVTTSLGAEGICGKDGIHFKVADTPQEFSDEVILLLNDSEKRESLGKNGQLLARQVYDWKLISRKTIIATEHHLSQICL